MQNFINRFSYKLDTVLYQFLEKGTSDRTLIGFDQLLKSLGFRLYPLSFFFNSPFKKCKIMTIAFLSSLYYKYPQINSIDWPQIKIVNFQKNVI